MKLSLVSSGQQEVEVLGMKTRRGLIKWYVYSQCDDYRVLYNIRHMSMQYIKVSALWREAQDYLQEFLQPYIRSESTQFYLAPEASSGSNNNSTDGLGPLSGILPFGPPTKWLQTLRGGNEGEKEHRIGNEGHSPALRIAIVAVKQLVKVSILPSSP